ncbi:hypothetical protein [Methanobrevibacter sp.]
MQFSFSIVGLLFLIMLFVPNIIWSRYPPEDYGRFSQNENGLLLAFERTGQVFTTIFALLCGADFSLNPVFLLSFLAMIVYEAYWIRYFKSPKTMEDMLGSFLMIPLPGATLPVFAFILLGIYSNSIPLVISSIVLGIGHVGIHSIHKNELN